MLTVVTSEEPTPAATLTGGSLIDEVMRDGARRVLPVASSSDFILALEGFLSNGSTLPAPTITRLTSQWQDEAKTFSKRGLSAMDCRYVWADGIHVNIRLDEAKLCLLVMIGVRVDGTEEFITLADGHRESSGSWADPLRDCARRGMRAPILAGRDGALGFWAALREVFPMTRAQCCCFHKIGNLLAALPKSALYDFPAEHWVHLRTTNPIESTFATVRHWTKVTKGPGSKAAGLTMAFRLIEAAQARWRAVTAPHLVALVRAGARFECGKLVERPPTGQHQASAA